MAEFFSEHNFDGKAGVRMHIPLEYFKLAIQISEIEERNMHLALTFDTDNKLGKVTEKIKN